MMLVIDDRFPYPTSGFRKSEFEYILKTIPTSRIVTTLGSLKWLNPGGLTPRHVLLEYQREKADLAGRVSHIDTVSSTELRKHYPDLAAELELIYCLFLNNAHDHIELAEKLNVPLVFTLYPGGGFNLGDPSTDAKLKRVLQSPMCKTVFVTMPVSRKYVEKMVRKLRVQVRVKYIFGGIHDVSNSAPSDRATARTPKKTLRLLFLGQRYHPQGKDKGLDLFLAACDLLSQRGHSLEPILVGPWTKSDVQDFYIGQRIQLLGEVPNNRLGEVFRDVDAAIFPTRASMLGDGSFDGFPVGSAAEAALHGVPVIMTNPLAMKTPFIPGIDYYRIRPTAKSVAKAIRKVSRHLYVGRPVLDGGMTKFKEVYNLENQMQPRIQAFLEILNNKN